MAVAVRLSRFGKKGHPFYRIVVVDKRSKRDGAYIENIGTYNPSTPLRQAQGRSGQVPLTPLRQAQGKSLRQAQGRALRQAQGRSGQGPSASSGRGPSTSSEQGPHKVIIKKERFEYWVGCGAEVSDGLVRLLKNKKRVKFT